jgi:hypothetical protein
MATLDSHPTRPDPSLLDSLIRAFEAGQRVVLDRLDLAYFDLAQIATRTVRGVVLIVIGSLLVVGAWFAVMGGLVLWLQQYVALPVSIALVAVGSAVVGGTAIALGVRRASGSAAAGIEDLVETVREGAPDLPQVNGAGQRQ